MTQEIAKQILERVGLDVGAAPKLTAFKSEEDGAEYAVWKVETAVKSYVLKEAKENEVALHKAYLSIESSALPHLYGVTCHGERDYLVMEYVHGNMLRSLDRPSITLALDALINLQRRFWGASEPAGAVGFEDFLARRRARGKHLGDEQLEQAYDGYLEQFQALPRTLCHDDLLPFNVMAADDRAVLIDWETAGILPYPTSLARLLAHGENTPDAFFHLTDEDRAFAVSYYYENLIREKGISYEDYRRSLDFCFFYEYCEWVMLGNKYGNTETERFKRYFALAKALAETLTK